MVGTTLQILEMCKSHNIYIETAGQYSLNVLLLLVLCIIHLATFSNATCWCACFCFFSGLSPSVRSYRFHPVSIGASHDCIAGSYWSVKLVLLVCQSIETWQIGMGQWNPQPDICMGSIKPCDRTNWNGISETLRPDILGWGQWTPRPDRLGGVQ